MPAKAHKPKRRSIPVDFPRQIIPPSYAQWYEYEATDVELKKLKHDYEKHVGERKAHKPLYAMNKHELADHFLSLPPDHPNRKQHGQWAKDNKR